LAFILIRGGIFNERAIFEKEQIKNVREEINKVLEEDYVMRLIKEMVRAVLKLLFNIDTDSPTSELLEDSEELGP
jgi:hypothetical protein